MSDTHLQEAPHIRLLEKGDDRKNFSCGQEDLDIFIQKYARQKQERYEQKTYIVSDKTRILAYMTIAPGELRPRDYGATGAARPVLRLLRLATDSRAQGQGYGRALMLYSFKLALNLSDHLGCVGLLVDSKKESVNFYKKLGFESLEDDPSVEPTPMFLKIDTIRQALDKAIL